VYAVFTECLSSQPSVNVAGKAGHGAAIDSRPLRNRFYENFYKNFTKILGDGRFIVTFIQESKEMH
jgi:hypothetical protein